MPEAYDFDLIAIGSGPAGQRAAIQAAKLGKRAAVIERQRVVGGVSVQTGTIPSKTFREAIWALGGAHGGRPAPAGARPTAEQLLARVGEVVAREIDVITDQLQRNEVAVIRG
ncbi:MAG TPA: FAD-dependent oxidoreductase, partial [Methylomirabilota bacterium]|nr:FAD-dependent oxidoreductase [Methylomirabilota bacterium]